MARLSSAPTVSGPAETPADPITVLAAVEPHIVTANLDDLGAPSIRAILDAVRDLPEHAAALDFSRGDRERMARFVHASGSLTRRSYAAITDAVERTRIPF